MESQPDQTILDSISSGTDITLSTILLYTPNIVDQHVTILYQICHYYQQLFIYYRYTLLYYIYIYIISYHIKLYYITLYYITIYYITLSYIYIPYGSMATVWEGTANPRNVIIPQSHFLFEGTAGSMGYYWLVVWNIFHFSIYWE